MLVLDQRFNVDGLYQLRAAVAAHSAELGLPLNLGNDVVIAVHELASNVVRHGPGDGRLRIWSDQQTLICEVADGARARRADQPPPAAASADTGPLPWPAEPGHGLWLVSKVADHFMVCQEDRGVTATARFTIDP